MKCFFVIFLFSDTKVVVWHDVFFLCGVARLRWWHGTLTFKLTESTIFSSGHITKQ